MALSLSNQALFSLRPSVSFSNPSATSLEHKTLALRSIRHHNCPGLNHSLVLGRPFSNLSSIRSRRSFKSSVSVEDSSIDTNNGATPNDALRKKQTPSLKTLFQVYKDAVLDEDEKTIAEINSIVYVMEKERNEVEEKMAALNAEITSGKEKLIRLQADFDNFRKRSEKDRLTIRTDAQGEVIESLLPMVDNFERAKQQIKPETEMEKKIDTSYQGIYKQFVEIMRSLRVGVVATVGKPFDPSLHEAISREESEEYKEGIITQEFRRGFLLGGRLLRPAMVKVSAGPGKKKIAKEPSTGKSLSVSAIDER